MRKEIVLGNGKMFINFDHHVNMCDFHYPYVGKYNHLNGNKSGIGVRVGETFSWINENWEVKFEYEKLALISIITATHKEMGVKLILRDAIHKQETTLLKEVEVINLNEKQIDISIYFYHWFNINETHIGNTVYFHPKLGGLLHYKESTYLFVSVNSECGFNYTTSKKDVHEGSWQEVENGTLSNRTIVQGEVDSAIEVKNSFLAGETKKFEYYIIAGRNYDEIVDTKRKVDTLTISGMLDNTKRYWQAWLQEKTKLHPSINLEFLSMYYKSLLIIRTHIDKGGAIIAANDTEIYKFNKDHYSYMWPRDGAFTAIALAHAGYSDIVRKFFKFCAKHITKDGFMLHKYSPDGTVGSSWHPWMDKKGEFQLPIQEDETALVLLALLEYYKDSKDIEFINLMYDKLVRKSANFLVEYRDSENNLPLASYDLWEERRGVLTYTCATVYAGLKSASYLANLVGNEEEKLRFERVANEIKEAMIEYLYDESLGRFIRMISKDAKGEWQKDTTIESSMFAIFEMGVLEANDERVVSTMRAIEEKLWVSSIGGIARYEGDYYHRVDEAYPGNPWIVTTLWLANWYIEIDEIEKALNLLRWVNERKTEAGLLAEQFNPHSGDTLSVNPLTWSHSSFCYTIQKLNKKLKTIPSLLW